MKKIKKDGAFIFKIEKQVLSEATNLGIDKAEVCRKALKKEIEKQKRSV